MYIRTCVHEYVNEAPTNVMMMNLSIVVTFGNLKLIVTVIEEVGIHMLNRTIDYFGLSTLTFIERWSANTVTAIHGFH